MTARPFVFAASTGLVTALDQLTKWLASISLTMGLPVPILGDVVRLNLVHNTGAAFGLFPGSRLPFIAVSLVAIGVVLFLFRRDAYQRVLSRALLGSILGGAVGNLVDRIRFGWVVDFIDIGVGGVRWPVFNVADSAVTLGVVLLAWNLARTGRAAPDAQDPSGALVAGG